MFSSVHTTELQAYFICDTGFCDVLNFVSNETSPPLINIKNENYKRKCTRGFIYSQGIYDATILMMDVECVLKIPFIKLPNAAASSRRLC